MIQVSSLNPELRWDMDPGLLPTAVLFTPAPTEDLRGAASEMCSSVTGCHLPRHLHQQLVKRFLYRKPSGDVCSHRANGLLFDRGNHATLPVSLSVAASRNM